MPQNHLKLFGAALNHTSAVTSPNMSGSEYFCIACLSSVSGCSCEPTRKVTCRSRLRKSRTAARAARFLLLNDCCAPLAKKRPESECRRDFARATGVASPTPSPRSFTSKRLEPIVPT